MHSVITVVAQYAIIISFLSLPFLFLRLPSSKRLRFMVFVSVSLLITLVLTRLAAMLHQDPRPFVRDGVQAYFHSATDNGFPSDHTVMSVFSAAVVYAYSRRYGILLLVLAVCIGIARVLANVHHTQDVIGGMVVAISAVVAGWYMSARFSPYLRKMASRHEA